MDEHTPLIFAVKKDKQANMGARADQYGFCKGGLFGERNHEPILYRVSKIFVTIFRISCNKYI